MNKLYYEEDLPFKIRGGKKIVDWIGSIGKKVRFYYKDIEDTLEIISCQKGTNTITIKYKELICNIQTESLKNCQLENLFSNVFSYEIGDIINNLRITDRYFKYKGNDKKQYKYTCLNCGWDNGEISEPNLKLGKGCGCCSGHKVVPGINDITTTDPWMIKYFQGGEDEASQYTSGSNKRIFPICPECNRIKDKSLQINVIKQNHSIGCNCSKTTSYPNKFIFKMLDQLQVQFSPEKVFEWAKFAMYDFYFVSSQDNKEYVIEADGGLGHGNYGTDFQKIESLYLDYRKDMIAEKHGVKVIRIDCKESSLDYIKNNILNSELKNILNLNDVNWELCSEYALNNIVKEICALYKNGNTVSEIHNIYQHLSKNAIRNYLHRGTEVNWCNYDGKQNCIETSRKNGLNNAKEIIVFGNNNNYICTWIGITDFTKNSIDVIGVPTDKNKITKACKTGKPYKGFYFKFKKDISEQDYLQMIGKIN